MKTQDTLNVTTEGAFSMGNLDSYKKDMQYLKEKSDKRSLNSDNGIYKSLDQKAPNNPELRRFLNTLNVNYV
ncbi:hypothetical protein B2J88_08895 [Rhodococcus sp. SRB_17]|nr:hypothetical protein [Rhodococcus sp. SRB_17]